MRFDPPRDDGFWRALNTSIGPVMRAPLAPPAQWAKAPSALLAPPLGCTYVEHVLASSLDWSPTSRLAIFLIGGLNAHAAHHLFPRVSHAHYRRISSAIAELAARHGVEYHCTGLGGMIAAHFRHLRRLGERPAFQK